MFWFAIATEQDLTALITRTYLSPHGRYTSFYPMSFTDEFCSHSPLTLPFSPEHPATSAPCCQSQHSQEREAQGRAQWRPLWAALSRRRSQPRSPALGSKLTGTSSAARLSPNLPFHYAINSKVRDSGEFPYGRKLNYHSFILLINLQIWKLINPTSAHYVFVSWSICWLILKTVSLLPVAI